MTTQELKPSEKFFLEIMESFESNCEKVRDKYKEKYESIDSKINDIKCKFVSVFEDTSVFDTEDFNKLLLILPNLTILISERIETLYEFNSLIRKIFKKREEDIERCNILQKQEDEKEWEEFVNSPSSTPEIVLKKEDFIQYVKKHQSI